MSMIKRNIYGITDNMFNSHIIRISNSEHKALLIKQQIFFLTFLTQPSIFFKYSIMPGKVFRCHDNPSVYVTV